MKTKDLVHIALFAAIVVALGLFPAAELPFSRVPITAQSLGVMLAGSILGWRRGGLALLVFVLLVVIGLPVLPGGRGGLGIFFLPSGGFVLSWPVAAVVVGYLTERLWNRYNLAVALIPNLVGGVLVVYAIGLPFMAAVAGISIEQAFTIMWAFVPGDVAKCVLAALAGVAVRRTHPLLAPAAESSGSTRTGIQ
ncbi:biotin transporter BioY [Kitasatospora sp. NPDC101235]|uniref:biotin transporter BioY n=1 Tax=Kitasatospora sp. NPDC101235 TaxID=3364101 RepID=UPI00380EB73F